MSISLNHLLPGTDESPRCAEHARSITVDPGGTAIRADRIVLVEMPLPWPKPALSDPRLSELADLLRVSTVPTRLLASVPQSTEGDQVIVFEREGGSAAERVYRASTPADLLLVGRGLASNDLSLIRSLLVEHHQPARPTVLVCTQGSHDVCCGAEGARFASDIDADSAGSASVHRVSHTGGHRFAPTAMTLPDGRMWANLDRSLLADIVTSTGDVESLAEHCRGWWGAETGPAQIAERAVFAYAGWDFDQIDRTITIEAGDPGAADDVSETTRICTVESSGQRWRVEVFEGREVPTISCRQPGGLPTKVAKEYRAAVVAVSRRR